MQTITKTVSDNYRQLSAGGQVVKVILLASNALILLFGLILIIAGGVAAGGQVNGLTSTTLASGVIVIGFFIMIIALFGAWGSMTENKVFLYIYFAFLVFFSLVLFAVGIAAYVKKDELPSIASSAWDVLYQNDRPLIDQLENSFQCCGWYNITDRSTPPLGNEPTCAGLHPNVGACSIFYYDILGVLYSSTTDPNARAGLAAYQTQHGCCGWKNLVEEPPSYWYPYAVNSSQTCLEANPTVTQTCFKVEQQLWYEYYYSSTPAGDAYVQSQQVEFTTDGSVGCCGWLSTTDAAVPPYTNNTCILTKGFNRPCWSIVDANESQSLVIVGGVGIALAVLCIATIILALVLIIKIPNRGSSNNRGFEHDDRNDPMEPLNDEE